MLIDRSMLWPQLISTGVFQGLFPSAKHKGLHMTFHLVFAPTNRKHQLLINASSKNNCKILGKYLSTPEYFTLKKKKKIK